MQQFSHWPTLVRSFVRFHPLDGTVVQLLQAPLGPCQVPWSGCVEWMQWYCVVCRIVYAGSSLAQVAFEAQSVFAFWFSRRHWWRLCLRSRSLLWKMRTPKSWCKWKIQRKLGQKLGTDLKSTNMRKVLAKQLKLVPIGRMWMWIWRRVFSKGGFHGWRHAPPTKRSAPEGTPERESQARASAKVPPAQMLPQVLVPEVCDPRQQSRTERSHNRSLENDDARGVFQQHKWHGNTVVWKDWHLNNGKKLGFLVYIGDYTTQFYRDYNTPL